MDALGERCISSELQLAGPEYGHLQGFSSLPPAFAEELFSSELLDKVSLHPLSQDMKTLKTPTVTVDNSLSPVHTLLQIQCVDQKGLCYDIMRISKDSDIKVLCPESLFMHANGLLLLPSEPLYMKLNQRKHYKVLPYLLLSLDLIISIFNLLILFCSSIHGFSVHIQFITICFVT